MSVCNMVFMFLRALFGERLELAAENLALRQQLAIQRRSAKRPKLRHRDNDKIYGQQFRRKVEGLDMEEVKITPRSPWQNPFAERVIGSIRRECLDHMIILDECHLRRVMKEYVEYYNGSRAHQSLAGNSPVPRGVEQPSMGDVVTIPFLGGLHHRYARAA